MGKPKSMGSDWACPDSAHIVLHVKDLGKPMLLLSSMLHTPNSGECMVPTPTPANANDLGMPMQSPIGACIGNVDGVDPMLDIPTSSRGLPQLC